MPWVLLICVLASTAAFGAEASVPRTANPHLQEALRRIRGLDEKGALTALESARRWPRNSPTDVALYQLYLGWAHAGLGHQEESIRAFKTALLIEPTLSLSPEASEKALMWFELARGKSATAAESGPSPATTLAPPVQAVSSERTRSPWRTWTASGLAVVGAITLVAAIASGVSASSSASQAKSASAVENAAQLQRDARKAATTANVLYGTSAVFGAGSAALFVF
jgi:hypothetical protein